MNDPLVPKNLRKYFFTDTRMSEIAHAFESWFETPFEAFFVFGDISQDMVRAYLCGTSKQSRNIVYSSTFLYTTPRILDIRHYLPKFKQKFSSNALSHRRVNQFLSRQTPRATIDGVVVTSYGNIAAGVWHDPTSADRLMLSSLTDPARFLCTDTNQKRSGADYGVLSRYCADMESCALDEICRQTQACLEKGHTATSSKDATILSLFSP